MAKIPPPLPSNRPLGNPAPTPRSGNIQNPRPSRKPDKNSKIWLIVGCVIAALAITAAVLLWLISDLHSGSYDYDDGNRHEKPLRKHLDEDDKEMEEMHIDFNNQGAAEEDTSAETAYTARSVHGIGVCSNSPFSMDIDVDDNGKVSGTYWNILYNLKFTVSGTQNASRDLALKLTIDGVDTFIDLYTQDGYNYQGSWGKNKRPVNIVFEPGNFPAAPSPGSTIAGGHASGGGLNADFSISYASNGEPYFWYHSQGFNNRLPVSLNPDGFDIYSRGRTWLATVSYNGDGIGTMRDKNDRTFNIKMH